MTPKAIGRYNILRELGHGAMGVVYEAEDPNIGRHVALKVVRNDQVGANREESIRRFKNEARAAGNLSHPNIITVHDAGEHEGMLYIAMEYVQGKTLADYIASVGRVAPGKAAEIMRQVCAGLDYAHARGIIHRDIKPANIMLTDTVVKITDFGIANVGDGMTITGTVVGTPNYMSPEQVLGKSLDGRSDLFSVAVILYEMLTGERPFDGQSITTVLYKIVHEDPISPRKLDGTIHPALSAIIDKALAKSPDARFATGAELAAALDSYRQLGGGMETAGFTAGQTASSAVTQTSLSAVYVPAATASQVSQPMPATPVAASEAAPERKKRGFSPFLMGCMGLVALSIVALTVVILVAIFKGQEKKKELASRSSQSAAVTPPEPTAPPPANAQVVKTSPAKAAKSTATLKMNSTPPGAEILLDGKSTGKETPESVSIPRGEHTVAVRMTGFQDASAKFKVSGGEEFEFSPQLVPLTSFVPKINVPNVATPDLSGLEALKNIPGYSGQGHDEVQLWTKWNALQRAGQLGIMFSSQPAGASIFLDEKDTGKKTPDVVRVDEGQHKVRLELDGYAPYEKVVSAGARRGPTRVNARLKSNNQ